MIDAEKKLEQEVAALKEIMCPVLRENYELKKEIEAQNRHRVELTAQIRDMLTTAKRKEEQ
jgi:hypothetical protein